ncbi:MAG TPA: VC0807 family protein [Micromonosporaceae bacterium]
MTVTAPAPATSTTAGPRPAALIGPLVGDLIAPIAIYYLARWLGASPVLALVLGGLACLPRQALEIVRRRRLDGLGTGVLIAFGLGVLVTLTTGSPRTMVVKDAIWPLAAGLVTAASLVRGKPVTFFLFRPMLTGGRPENRPFWDRVWAGGAPFRHCLRVLAAFWAIWLTVAGAVEIALAARLPLDQAAAVPSLVPIVAVPVLLGVTALYAKNTGLGVRRSLDVVPA